MATNATQTRAPIFYEVPAGTLPSQCRGKTCRAVIFWIERNGKRLPIDCDVEGGQEPMSRVDGDPGCGVSHFTTCADVRQFSRGSRA